MYHIQVYVLYTCVHHVHIRCHGPFLHIIVEDIYFPQKSTGHTFTLPIYAFLAVEPEDGWPNKCDWTAILMDMLNSGEDFKREPIDIKFPADCGGKPIGYGAVGVCKGTARLTCPQFVLMHAMRQEATDTSMKSVVKILRVAIAIPSNYTHHVNAEGHSFDKLYLSCRSTSIRQRPHPLRQARMFHELGRKRIHAHPDVFKDVPFETVIDQVIQSYHVHKGVRNNPNYSLGADELQAVRNVALYVDEGVMRLSCKHLHRFKFAESGALTLCLGCAWCVLLSAHECMSVIA